MLRKTIDQMTPGEIEREKRELAAWLLDFTTTSLCAYSLDALRNAYDALVESVQCGEDELAGARERIQVQRMAAGIGVVSEQEGWE